MNFAIGAGKRRRYDEGNSAGATTALLQRPRRQFRRRLTWPGPGPGAGIWFWAGGDWARVDALPRIGGEPADELSFGALRGGCLLRRAHASRRCLAWEPAHLRARPPRLP